MGAVLEPGCPEEGWCKEQGGRSVLLSPCHVDTWRVFLSRTWKGLLVGKSRVSRVSETWSRILFGPLVSAVW